MKNTLLFLTLLVSLFCSNSAARAGGDTPQPLASDVVWSIDTLDASPFKYSFEGFWFSQDGKIVISQNKQLFLVNPETGKVFDKKNLPCKLLEDFQCDYNKNHLILFEDTTLYMYDLKTYELVKSFDIPDEIHNMSEDNLATGKCFGNVSLSADSKKIVAVFTINSPQINQVWSLDVANGKYTKIMEPYFFMRPKFSPNGKFLVAYECESYTSGEEATAKFYDAQTFDLIYDTEDSGIMHGNLHSFSVTGDTVTLKGAYKYNSYAHGLFLLNTTNAFEVINPNFKDTEFIDYLKINDTLSYCYYINSNGSDGDYQVLYNSRTKQIVYKYNFPEFQDRCGAILSPDKKYIIFRNYKEIHKSLIPYDNLTKTEEEIQQINTGFTLAPNPAYEIVNYSIYLKKDQNIKYSISQKDGKEIKTGEIGYCSAGYATGSLYLQDIPVGEYIVVFYGEAGKVAQGKVCLVR